MYGLNGAVRELERANRKLQACCIYCMYVRMYVCAHACMYGLNVPVRKRDRANRELQVFEHVSACV
jgi:hypothetical protein